ncbi:uncharacterized protein LOC117891425 [Drosophila subobscura]|uniref:uncharacterized protein LOC117891425 n=1 Tax=Drosophila subobscura TaxID=7241 RepID=UPI00155A1EE4|nr:uncharacterized protein LOC117891425 [Drosophila subobscura]
MLTKPKCLCVVLQLSLVCLSRAIEYEFMPDKDGLFAPCENHPAKPAGFDTFLDMSQVEVAIKEGSTIQMSGDAVVVWQGVEPSDTVTMFAQVYQHEQGTWQKTMFSAGSKNFCKNMFEKNQYWHTFWTKHISNSDEVKKTCVNTRGSLLKHEFFELELKANLNVPNMKGRYKLMVLFEAFDKRHVKRPVSACTEFRGTIQRV